MIILRNAYSTSITVIATLRDLILTNETDLFNAPLIVVVQKILNVLRIASWFLEQQQQIKNKSESWQSSLQIEEKRIIERDKEINNKDIEKKRNNK